MDVCLEWQFVLVAFPLTYLKTLWPVASAIIWTVWAGLLFVGIVRWFGDSFAPVTSMGDLLYRLAFVIFGIPILAFFGAAICDGVGRLKRKIGVGS